MKYLRKRYPDGGIYAEVEDFSNPVITERINSYEDLFFLRSLKEVCDFNKIKDVSLVIPCMFQQQHDRRFQNNQSFELKIVTNFINSCNFSSVDVFHPHSDATQMGLDNVHVIDNSKFVTEVLEDMNNEQYYRNDVDKTHPILLSTDAGSYKWINKLADVLEFKGEVYGANKARDQYTHKLTQVIDRQDFEGRDILILDDLCVFGGTFIGLAKLLKERNVGKLYLGVSHMTVKNPSKEMETCYEKVYCTNSKFDRDEYDLQNLTVFNHF